MAFSDWSTNADSNGTTLGVNQTEGATPLANMNNAVRAVMAQLRAAFSTGLASFFAGTAALPVANGGTGSTTASAARTALGVAASGANTDITSLAGLTTALSIAQGGTGGTTAAAARSALAAIGLTTSSIAAATGYIKFNIGGTDFLLQWKDATASANTSTAVTYPTAFASWSRAWCNGGRLDSTAQDNNPFVSSGSETTSGCTVFNSRDESIPVTVFAIGV